jgi:hypothetical protein
MAGIALDRCTQTPSLATDHEAAQAIGRDTMLYTLTILIIGIFIGWNLPQPPWARDLQDRVVRSIRTMLDQSGGGPK